MPLLDTSIEYLKGVGPKRAELLQKELGIFTFRDLLQHYPHRYIDKTQFHRVRELSEHSGEVQLRWQAAPRRHRDRHSRRDAHRIRKESKPP